MPRKNEEIDISPYLQGRLLPNRPYVSVTKGQAGYFAVIYWHNPEHGGFWEPLDTGTYRGALDGAIVEAQELAEEYHLTYRPLKEDQE